MQRTLHHGADRDRRPSGTASRHDRAVPAAGPGPAADAAGAAERPATPREAELEAEVARLRRALAAAERSGAREVEVERRAAAALAESEARLRLAQEAAEVGVFERDVLTGRAHWSPAMFRLYGLDPAGRAPEVSDEEYLSLLDPADREGHRARRDARRADPAAPRYAHEFRIRRADTGEVRWISSCGEIVRDAAGRPLLVRGTNHDITERRRAEFALAESEARFRSLAEALPGFVWTATADGAFDWVSPRWYACSGARPGAALGWGWGAWLHPDDVSRVAGRWRASVAAGAPEHEDEFRLRGADGEYRWFLTRVAPVRGADGRVERWVGTCTDVDPRHKAEERQSLLVNELNHRVKNSLAVALALADQTRRACAAADHPPERFHADFQTRMVALSAAHDLLTREHWEGAPLTALVRTALAPHAGKADGSAPRRVSASGPPVRLAPETALALAMAMHELATNAAKHGALSVPGGRVEVGWRVEPPPGGTAAAGAGGGTLVLEWAEHGGPPVPGPPKRRGFGSRLIERGCRSSSGAAARWRSTSRRKACAAASRGRCGRAGPRRPPRRRERGRRPAPRADGPARALVVDAPVTIAPTTTRAVRPDFETVVRSSRIGRSGARRAVTGRGDAVRAVGGAAPEGP
jgi:PAS domain S-box-containing protein